MTHAHGAGEPHPPRRAPGGAHQPDDYEQLLCERRAYAQERIAERLAAVRQNVTDSGLDVSVVDEAIAAARARD